MKTILQTAIVIVTLAAGVLVAWYLIQNRPEAATRAPERAVPWVDVQRVELAPRQLTVTTHGTVMPRTESTLAPEISGRVVSISPSLANGGFFEKGEVLIRLDDRDYELARIAATSRVAQAQSLLAREEAEAEVARQEWNQLRKEGEEPSPLTLRIPQLAEAHAALEAARAELERAERNLAKTRLTAPYNGRVRQKNVDVGQFVVAGATLATVYAVDYAEIRLPIAPQEVAYVDLPLDYRDAESPATTADVEAILSARIGNSRYSWKGRIVRTEGEVDRRTRFFYAIAQVEDPYGKVEGVDRPPLAAGLFVEATILGRVVEDVFVMPRIAARGEDQDIVLVVDEEDRLHFREVEVLRREGDELIISGGLEPGERVCVSRVEVAVENMPVRTQPVDAPEPAPSQQASAEEAR